METAKETDFWTLSDDDSLSLDTPQRETESPTVCKERVFESDECASD